MQAKERNEGSAHMQFVVKPLVGADTGADYQEVSHVFHCMQCNLQFQMDIAVTSRKGTHEIDEGVVRVRLDPRIKLEREE